MDNDKKEQDVNENGEPKAWARLPLTERRQLKRAAVKYVKPRFRFIRDEFSTPIVTQCILNDGVNCYIGFAVCSKKDHPRKLTGRKIALDRAILAYLRQHSSLPVCRHEIEEAFGRVNMEIPLFKSCVSRIEL